jgi:heterotetrameric sarcosine oxidase gamma subunit
MNAPRNHAGLRCELTIGSADSALEFLAFAFPPPATLPVEWPRAPGALRRNALGRAAVLHVAPSRWLLPAPGAEELALVEAATAAGEGLAVAVAGKWAAMTLAGPDATRLLASSLDVEAVLAGRDCAAVTLFDCRALIAREGNAYLLWLGASYAAEFAAAVARLKAGA